MSPTQPKRRLDPIDLAATLAFVAGATLAAVIWRYGPAGPLAIHFDFHGRPDGWGDRTFIAGLQAGLTVLMGLCYLGMEIATRGKSADDAGRRGRRAAKLVIVCVGVPLSMLTAVMTFGVSSSPQQGGRMITSMLALIFLVVGALLGRAGPNPFVGVRTYWTFRSRLAWDKSNRLAGRLFFWLGLVGLLASLFLDPAVVTPVLIVGILAAAAASVFESWRVWRSDPERHRP